MANSGVTVDVGKPLNIVIVGGSCAGLIAGILLKRKGHHVTILEQAVSNEREGTAAGIGLAGNVKRFFDENDLLKDVPFGAPAGVIKFLSLEKLEVTRKVPYNAAMTTWDATYYRLRANFDAMQSRCCEKPPVLEDEGEGIVETGKRVVDVKASSSGTRKVILSVEDRHGSGTNITYTADVVIAADGGNSTLRRQLQPNITRELPGYLLWRGTVPTNVLPRSLLDKIEGDTIVHPMKGYTYAIIYTIPGEDGSLKDGERHINFAWYYWPSSASELQSILTDVDGYKHRTTLPKGKMRSEIWERQKTIARQCFHPELLPIVEGITEPFVSVVSSIRAKNAAFLDNRLFLVGDALVQCQPNTGQGEQSQDGS